MKRAHVIDDSSPAAKWILPRMGVPNSKTVKPGNLLNSEIMHTLSRIRALRHGGSIFAWRNRGRQAQILWHAAYDYVPLGQITNLGGGLKPPTPPS